MTSDESLHDHRSRRALLRGAGVTVAAGAALGLTACGGTRHHHVPADPVAARADVALLNAAIDAEYHAIAAYTAGIPILGGRQRDAAKQFLNQDLTHATELISLIKKAGGAAHDRSPSYDLGHPRTARDVLALLNTLENRQIAAYVDAIPRLSPGSVRASVASILANDAEHVSILNVALGTPGAPDAFVTGRE